MVSEQIKAWLDSENWVYEHHTPDDDDEMITHYFSLGFSGLAKGSNFQWGCIIRVQEKTQLVTLYGLPKISIPPDHRSLISTMAGVVSYAIGFGSIDFNIKTGGLHAKVSFDAEFTVLSNRALSSYFTACASITAKAHELITNTIDDPNAVLEFLLSGSDDYYLVNDIVQ